MKYICIRNKIDNLIFSNLTIGKVYALIVIGKNEYCRIENDLIVYEYDIKGNKIGKQRAFYSLDHNQINYLFKPYTREKNLEELIS